MLFIWVYFQCYCDLWKILFLMVIIISIDSGLLEIFDMLYFIGECKRILSSRSGICGDANY